MTDKTWTVANKLPAITASFWILKIIATTLGETGGDWLSMTMNVGYMYSTLIFFGLFPVALGLQLKAKIYHPFLFWTVIVATSTAGTTMSDYMDRTLQLGYAKGSAILIGILISILSIWWLTNKDLRVGHIRTRRSELFYWLTVLFSNTLGTALGDFLADDSGLGFFGGWCLITGILVAILALTYFTKINRVLLFWMAFVLTRPFGATFGDVLTKSQDIGGLNLGTGRSSLILLTLLVIVLLVVRRRQRTVLLFTKCS